MDTQAAAVLVAATATGSLSSAARRLGLSPMIATRRLAALERDLGVCLMHRTTRALSLTPEGEAFLPYAESIVEGEAAARAILRSAKAGASGLLRISAPVSFGRKIIAPFVPALLEANPDLRIDLDLNDHIVDIVSSGIDLAIRIAKLRDSTLIARRLSASPRRLCASPAYLAKHGAPKTVADLVTQDCLALTGVTHWPFRENSQDRPVPLARRFTCNSIEGLLEVCLHGGGIALIADWNIRDDIRDGRLVTLTLTDATPADVSIWAVYPAKRQILPKHRVFMSALQAAIALP